LAAGGHEATIGEILKLCYRDKILTQPSQSEQPSPSPSDTEKAYFDQVPLIVEGLVALNNVFQFEPVELKKNVDQKWRRYTFHSKFFDLILPSKNTTNLFKGDPEGKAKRLLSTLPLQKVFGLQVHALFKMLQIINKNLKAREELACALGDAFRVDDLNIRSLRSIGKLSIHWTAYVDNHLRLDLRESILWVLWDFMEVGSKITEWQEAYVMAFIALNSH
jgi:hypothetical protein